jgi:hypothetical protein
MDKHNRPNDESGNGKAPHEGSDDDPVNEKPAGQSEFDDEIGYGKPPKKSQFKKGTSGNPKGRPKGSRNVGTLLKRILEERVTVNENGCRKSITKEQAALKQQVNKAASGDRHAFQLVFSLRQRVEEDGGDKRAQLPMSEDDRKILQDFMKRCGNSNITGDDNEPKSE